MGIKTCQRDTDFTNLQPGDEITQIWTVQPNGWVSGRKDGDSQIRPTAVGDPAVRNLFVSKRAPRPLKVGDDFRWSRHDIGVSARTIIHIDAKGVLYDYISADLSGRVYEAFPCRRGEPMHVT